MIHILIYGLSKSFGGTERVFASIYKKMQKNTCIFYYPEENSISAETNGLIDLSFLSKKRRVLKSALKKNKIDYIIWNLNSFGNPFFYLGKIFFFKKNYFWAHFSSMDKKKINIIKKTLMPLVYKIVSRNKLICVSSKSGRFVFGNNKAIVIKNCIDENQFLFVEERRAFLRNKYKIKNDNFIIGTVTRLEENKNPILFIKIAEKYLSTHKNFIFVLVGSGSLQNLVQKEIIKMNLSKKIIFIPHQQNVEDYYSFFDGFISTSPDESLGMTIMEAQLAGLDVVCSKGIPYEAMITNNCHVVLNYNDINEWCKLIDQIRFRSSSERKKLSQKVKKEIEKHNFNSLKLFGSIFK